MWYNFEGSFLTDMCNLPVQLRSSVEIEMVEERILPSQQKQPIQRHRKYEEAFSWIVRSRCEQKMRGKKECG